MAVDVYELEPRRLSWELLNVLEPLGSVDEAMHGEPDWRGLAYGLEEGLQIPRISGKVQHMDRLVAVALSPKLSDGQTPKRRTRRLLEVVAVDMLLKDVEIGKQRGDIDQTGEPMDGEATDVRQRENILSGFKGDLEGTAADRTQV